MKILVLNCGSSSIKYALYNMDDKSVMTSGGAERVGLDGAFVKVKLANGEKKQIMHDIPEHTEGVKFIFSLLTDPEIGVIKSLDEIDAAFGKTGALVDLAYSQSAHFVSWIATLKGDEGVRTLIREVAMGKPFDDAFFDVYERSPKAAFAIWYDRMSREKSLLASIFSRDGLFFFISLFAAFGLIIALWRKSVVRKRRKANMNQAVPVTALPENLRNFGPFTMYMK